VTTERAPLAGQQNARGGAGGPSGGGSRSLLEGILDTGHLSSNPVMDQLLHSQGRSPFELGDPQTPGGNGSGAIGSGAAAAAGVLTAVDEDGEGDEEAGIPSTFEYFSDGEEDEE